MDERPADVERQIQLTRDRMADTVAEIEDRISEKTAAVKRRLDLFQLASDHPWPAVAVAFAAGLLLSATGADRKAARGAKDAALGAADAAADAAKNAGPMLGDAVSRVKSRFSGSSSPSATTDEEPGTMSRLADRAADAIGVDDLRLELERGARME